jgi:glycosyltransferase involved in cell wall biosynthesis
MTCGVGDYTACLAAALGAQPGVEAAVLSSIQATGADNRTAVEVFPVIQDWASNELEKVREVVRRWKPDIVHIQFPTQGYRGGTLPWILPVARLVRPPSLVQTWHEYFPEFTPGFNWHGIRWAAYALALSRGDVVVVRPDYRAHMPRRWRLLTSHKRFELIPNAPSIPRVAISTQERDRIRSRYAPDGRALLVFFGFFFEHKGIDDLLQIMDVERQRLVLVGDLNPQDPYQARLARRLGREPFVNSVSWTGFLPPVDVGQILAAADAVILPLRAGAGNWNTSAQAAILQGTFLLTTSLERHGYDPDLNVYHALPGDIADLKSGLEQFLGRRNPRADREELIPTWSEIARRHVAFYETRCHLASRPLAQN